MTKKPAPRTLVWTLLATVLLVSFVARAQPESIVSGAPRWGSLGTNAPPWAQATVDTSFTGAGPAKFLGTKSGDSDAFNVRAIISTVVPVNEKWSIPLGLGSQNIFLRSVPGEPVDDAIHTLSFNTGVRYRVNDDWMLMGLFDTTLYRVGAIRGKDFGLSGGVMAGWRYSPSLRFVFGLLVAPDSDLPALPMAGADWLINDAWELRLLFPQPRLIYRADDRWSFFLGANLVAATFRAGETRGTSIGMTQYDNALATYRDVRLGAGLGCSLTTALRLEAEAGYSVSRAIDFRRLDETVRFDPAPYVRLGLRWAF